MKLIRKTKEDYFQNSNIRDLSDNRKFWKTIKPYFTNKGLNSNKLLVEEKGNLVSNEKQLATIMNSFFINIAKGLEIKDGNESNANTLEDVLDAFNSYPNIERIMRTVKTNEKVSFQPVPQDLVRGIILNLDSSKATPVGDNPADMLKSTVDIHLSFITKIINFSHENGCFPDELKIAKVSPVFKKSDGLDKENYRPASILSHVSKVFERIIYMQIDTFMRDKLSKVLTGYRKNQSIQHCLMSMREMWKNTLDKGGYVSAIFVNLSKVFDTLNHNLLIAKLGTYGFERDPLSFMKSYLNDRQQRVRVKNNFSSWEK